MKIFSLTSPAKINVDLRIGKRKKNGLHEISTHMQTIFLHDTLTITAEKSEKNEVLLELNSPNDFSVPTDSTNVAVQAAKLFLENSSVSPQKIRISFEKKIPVCAGLGGGSSNAGTVLRALSQLFPESIPKNIIEIAHTLGSDVPFFLHNFSAAKVTGTGEKIEKKSYNNFGKCLIVQPKNLSISTAWAYEKWDEKDSLKKLSNPPQSPLIRGEVSNDFQTLLLPEFPVFQSLHDIFEKNGAKKHGLCGSGSAWYGFFENSEKAYAVTKKFDSNNFFVAMEE